MSEYLKMADEFSLPVKDGTLEVYCRQHIGESFGSCEVYAAHAINSHDALVEQRDELLAALEDLKREIILSDVDMDYIDSHFRPWLNKATLAIDNAKGGAE